MDMPTSARKSTRAAKKAEVADGQRRRLPASERRELVLEAAIDEFAEHGYHGTSTPRIARRAGIAQSYIYRLFSDKRALFLACQDSSSENIAATFRRAAVGANGFKEAFERMGRAYVELLSNRSWLLCVLQGCAAAADPDIGAHVSANFTRVMDEIQALTGAPREQVISFTADGMYLNIATALQLPELAEAPTALMTGRTVATTKRLGDATRRKPRSSGGGS